MASVLVPVVLGAGLAVLVMPLHAEVAGIGFVLFLGAAMPATAFPAPARILRDTGRDGTPVARSAPAEAGPGASAALTEWAGLHGISGAFLSGMVMPGGAAEAGRDLTAGVDRVGTALLLPICFVPAGTRVDPSAADVVGFGELTAVLVVAVVGKTGAVSAAGRVTGSGRHDAVGLAVPMDTRGLTGIVALTTGLRLGLIDERPCSLVVVMAILTTLTTAPSSTLPDRRRAAVVPHAFDADRAGPVRLRDSATRRPVGSARFVHKGHCGMLVGRAVDGPRAVG